MRSKHPFIIGAVLFGSLSKGKQLNEDTEGQSDIDTVIYIDEDEARKEYSSLSGGKNEIFNEWIAVDREMHAHYEYRTGDEKMYELIGDYVNGLAEDSLKQKLPHHKLFKHIMGIGINTKAISVRGQNSINQTFENIFFPILLRMTAKLKDSKEQ